MFGELYVNFIARKAILLDSNYSNSWKIIIYPKLSRSNSRRMRMNFVRFSLSCLFCARFSLVVVPSFTWFAFSFSSPFLSFNPKRNRPPLSLSLSLSFNLAHDKSSTFDLSRVACPPFLHASYPFRFSIPPPPSLSPPFLGRSTFASFNSTCLSFFSFFSLFFLFPSATVPPFPLFDIAMSRFCLLHLSSSKNSLSFLSSHISRNWPVKKTFSNKKSNCFACQRSMMKRRGEDRLDLFHERKFDANLVVRFNFYFRSRGRRKKKK